MNRCSSASRHCPNRDHRARGGSLLIPALRHRTKASSTLFRCTEVVCSEVAGAAQKWAGSAVGEVVPSLAYFVGLVVRSPAAEVVAGPSSVVVAVKAAIDSGEDPTAVAKIAVAADIDPVVGIERLNTATASTVAGCSLAADAADSLAVVAGRGSLVAVDAVAETALQGVEPEAPSL